VNNARTHDTMKRSASTSGDILIKKTKSSVSGEEDKSSSVVLKSIIGASTIDSFLRDTYQIRPCIYHVNVEDNGNDKDKDIDKDNDMSSVLKSIYSMGWDGVSSMLHKSQSNLKYHSSDDHGNMDATSLPLFFRNQEAIQLDEIKNTYGSSPFAAYLDGCSVVNNHADLLSPPLAALCLDLQRSLPHAYVNTYLTPPSAAAVSAHADDRDVFVIQVMGEKQWRVYGEVPIPYPSTKEQVGKGDLKVPDSVLQQKPLFEIILKRGDVLYMPRGFVHEASTNTSEPSFHATVAIATHDWSLSKTITEIVSERLDSEVKFRMAVHPYFGMMKNTESVGSDQKEVLNGLLKDAMERITSSVNIDTVANHLGNKYRVHNNHVQSKRQELINDDDSTHQSLLTESTAIVGPEAANRIRMNTKIRASTPEERASAPPPIATHGRGLTVREETCDALLSILGILRNENKTMEVEEFRRALPGGNGSEMVCDLTLLSFAKCCVELGAMALVLD